MYRKIEDFQNAWNYEAEMTGKVIHTLTDEAAQQKVTEDGRSLAFGVASGGHTGRNAWAGRAEHRRPAPRSGTYSKRC